MVVSIILRSAGDKSNSFLKHTFLSFVIVLLLMNSIKGQSLSQEERRLADSIDGHLNETIQFLEKVVNIESPTENLTGVKKVGDAFGAELELLGFTTKWIEMPKSLNRAGHLLAEHKGSQGKRLLLIGHLDTVLYGERFARDGTVARGTGVSDMKGGDVILLFALKSLQTIGALENKCITVFLTGDEENPGFPIEASRRDLIEAAKHSDLVLSFEPEVNEMATVGRRGISSWKLEVLGETGHSGSIFGPELGSGAIFEAARVLNAFYESLNSEKYLTFNPSLIVGGTEVKTEGWRGNASGKLNVVAQRVIVAGDLRFISEEQKEHAKAKMREIVAGNLPRTKATIGFEDDFPPMSPTPGNYALLKQLNQVSFDLGSGRVEALDPSERGAGDISVVSSMLDGLDGLGLGGGNDHAPGEYAHLNRMSILIKRAAVLIYRLTR